MNIKQMVLLALLPALAVAAGLVVITWFNLSLPIFMYAGANEEVSRFLALVTSLVVILVTVVLTLTAFADLSE